MLICLIGCSYESNEFKILQPKADSPDFLNLMNFKYGKSFICPCNNRNSEVGVCLTAQILRVVYGGWVISRCRRIIA